MSAEYEAAQEVCNVLHAIDGNLDRIYKDMPSRRERIVTAAMQGYLALHAGNDIPSPSAEECAERAVAYADALINALDAKNPQLEKVHLTPMPGP